MGKPTVVIEEVIGRAAQGVTEPFICRGDDAAIYFVKGVGAGRRSQVCEWVAAQMATYFGLPIAPYALAYVPEELIVAQSFPRIRDLGAGIAFASRQLPHAQELNLALRERVPPEMAADILVFDWWLRNEDRHLTEMGGNPNLLWDMEANSLAVIDHNQAFDRFFNVQHFLDTHVFSDHWNQIYSDVAERLRYQVKMKAVLARLAEARDSIPEHWWWVDEGVPADISWVEISACLERCHHGDFWNIP